MQNISHAKYFAKYSKPSVIYLWNLEFSWWYRFTYNGASTIKGIILVLIPTDDLILNSWVEEYLIGSYIQDLLSVAIAPKQWKN